MNYQELLKNAPPHDTDEFLQYLREHNKVIAENTNWLVIENCKYDWFTAFAKVNNPKLGFLLRKWGHREWKVKPKDKRSVTRFHIHIL